jgi:cell division protein FtsB
MRAFRVVLVILVLMLAWLQYRYWFGAGGQREVAGLRDAVEAQARDNVGLRERNDALAAEVEDLKSGEAAIEERARSELGMIRPGETFYRVVDPDAGGDGAAGAATAEDDAGSGESGE